MYKAFILCSLLVSPISSCFANPPSPYTQTQINTLQREISQLQVRRDQLMKEKQAFQGPDGDSNVSFRKQQLQTEIDKYNSKISSIEKQIQALQKGS